MMQRVAEHLYSIAITLWVGALWAIGYLAAPTLFRLLDDKTPVYGFWLVVLKRANLDDLNALREHTAAVTVGQPFKTLSSTARKDIGTTLVSEGLVDYIDRKQVPVILDFRTGDVWLGNSGKTFVEALTFYLTGALGAKLTGGGGGGCVVALAPGREADVAAAWERAGFSSFLVKIGTQ